MQTDINAIVAGIGGDGVVSGCAVTAQGAPDMTVAVAAGVVSIAGVSVTVASGNVTITTADGTNPRIDLIVVDNAGAKSATAGTAAANPKAPDIPANSVLLAMVYVPASDTTIASNQITDKRALLNTVPAARGGAVREGRADGSGNAWLSIPGGYPVAVATITAASGRYYYEAWRVITPITIDALVCELVTGIAGGEFRMGIYNSDEHHQPTSLIVDSGGIAAEVANQGARTFSTTQALAPGLYLAVLQGNNSSLAFRAIRVAQPFAIIASLGANPFPDVMAVNGTYGALPSTGTAWNTGVTGGSTPIKHMVMAHVSVP